MHCIQINRYRADQKWIDWETGRVEECRAQESIPCLAGRYDDPIRRTAARQATLAGGIYFLESIPGLEEELGHNIYDK